MDLNKKHALPDLICLSHLRWNFVWQRPQHLLSRFAKRQRVFFVEEPIVNDDPNPRLDIKQHESGVKVVVPHVPLSEWEAGNGEPVLHKLFDTLFINQNIGEFFYWYYTPMAFEWTKHKSPSAIIYDCMDELSAFKGAPPQLIDRERQIFEAADLVFTGGQSLYEAKRDHHERVFAFPSSVDTAHFAQARSPRIDPADQRVIPRPRLGFFGVVDERMDLALIDAVAAARPDWHTVILGPCAKIDPAELPRRDNIHYLGIKRYEELPDYLAGWDVATLPFARNESTQFISPTKTPEYLAAGRPVVATSVRDVVRPYGELGLVSIADSVSDFVRAIEAALSGPPRGWRTRVDRFLSKMSWDRTWTEMAHLIDGVLVEPPTHRAAPRLDVGRLLPAGRSL